MAIFRKGVKLGKGGMNDVRVSLLSKSRAKGLLRKAKIIDDGRGRKQFEVDARGEVDLYRRAVTRAEGFQNPAQFKVTFEPPLGISHPTFDRMKAEGGNPNAGDPRHRGGSRHRESEPVYNQGDPNGFVRGGGIDFRTHKMNFSVRNGTFGTIKEKYEAAAQVAKTLWNAKLENTKLADKSNEESEVVRTGKERQDTMLNLFCSKVSIPEKSINFASMRHYGTHFAYPQNVQYGAITTTFYCDGTMHIKNFFDAWQKLIYNDLTGNFNYYDEYISKFDIYTRGTVTSGKSMKPGKKTGAGTHPVSKAISEGTTAFNDMTGVENPRNQDQAVHAKPQLQFINTYGVRVLECWPQIVSSIDLGHAGTNQPAEFSVTWAYKKWNTFNMGNIGKRGEINLAVGEFRNEKDGFPFLEDLPQELAGPLSGAMNQATQTSALSKASNLLG